MRRHARLLPVDPEVLSDALRGVARWRAPAFSDAPGLSTSKVRFYERRKLLQPAARLANGFRDYDDHALEVLVFIGRAQRLGSTLREVATHLCSPQGDGRKARLPIRLEAKLAELDALAEQLRERREMLVDLIQELRSVRNDWARP